MRVLAAFLLLAVGCRSHIPSAPVTQWQIPEIRVRTQWILHDDDDRAAKLSALCERFNDALYDAFDGQVFVKRFTIYSKNRIGEKNTGIMNVYDAPYDDKDNNPHGYPAGRPWSPMRFYVPLSEYGRPATGMLVVHEWMHSWIGAYDEYQIQGRYARCPSKSADQLNNNACVMYLGRVYSELCRPDNHNQKTDQGDKRAMSCYAWAAKVIGEYGIKISIPDRHIRGPYKAPKARIYFQFE